MPPERAWDGGVPGQAEREREKRKKDRMHRKKELREKKEKRRREEGKRSLGPYYTAQRRQQGHEREKQSAYRRTRRMVPEER